jgi:1-acyl-sn-glycerol-3-phosphate acyltransferase
MQPPGCYIGIQPPHGLFPFGGLLGMFAMPRFVGFSGRGIAASAILAVPVIGQLLKTIGCIDASRDNVKKYLASGESIGVSTGGIAEIFEANAKDGCECIIMKSRGGICKLALQHGVPIVPGYLFGNSKCLNVWTDRWGVMQWLSRKLQISIVLFSGRWGLPIPYRTPLLSITGDKIVVAKVQDPTPEQIQELLDTVIDRTVELFDKHKPSFGWENVKLVVK